MTIHPYSQTIYDREAVAWLSEERRPLSTDQVRALAADVVGSPVQVFTPTDEDREAGRLAYAFWQDGSAYLVGDEWNDLLLAHEIAHLLADVHGYLGHDVEWLRLYLRVLRSWHRHSAANVLREFLGPIVAQADPSLLEVNA